MLHGTSRSLVTPSLATDDGLTIQDVEPDYGDWRPADSTLNLLQFCAVP